MIAEDEEMNIFISWSGKLSREIAEEFKKWLPDILDEVTIFFSPEDIEKGENWNARISEELSKSTYGIVFLTKENSIAPWINFEAGAIAKTLESRVTAIMIDLNPSDIIGPLSRFQATALEEKEIHKLVNDINKTIEHPLTRDRINRLFNKFWPDFNEKVIKIKESFKSSIEVKVKDVNKEILEEILLLSRKQNTLLSEKIGEDNKDSLLILNKIIDLIIKNQENTEKIYNKINSLNPVEIKKGNAIKDEVDKETIEEEQIGIIKYKYIVLFKCDTLDSKFSDFDKHIRKIFGYMGFKVIKDAIYGGGIKLQLRTKRNLYDLHKILEDICYLYSDIHNFNIDFEIKREN